MSSGGGGSVPRVIAVVSGAVPDAPRLELMEQDSKDSAQSSGTSSSCEVQPEYNVRHVCVCVMQTNERMQCAWRMKEIKAHETSFSASHRAR